MKATLLFDLGGVIMDIDRLRAVKAFQQLGMDNADDFFDPYCQRGLFLQLEQGLISPEEFRSAVRPLFSRNVSDEEIDAGLMKFLIGIPEERLLRLLDLRRAGCKVFLLSNTNPIMWNAFISSEFRKLGGDFSTYFDGGVTSFEAKCCKPDARIYQLAQQKLGIIPAETVFFDDGLANVEAARQLGFGAEHVTPENDFMTLTEKYL
ncbi:MAG: HAD family phosphatase [Bacteroidales bacterium]|nr:HAD family phosphatase [Bacteroidales bacterium]